MTHLEKKKIHPLLRPQSADRKTSYGVQRAETHFFHKLFFEILLFWAYLYSSSPFFHILPIDGGYCTRIHYNAA
jgi:hypothetical protein